MRTCAKLVRSGLVAIALTAVGCGPAQRVRVAVDVDNGSTDTGRPDSAQMQFYCDETLVVDSVLGNMYSGPPYKNSESVNRHWLRVTPGPHRLRVRVPKHNLALDTVLVLDPRFFTSVTLHHHIRARDTLRFASGKVAYVVPAETTSKIVLSKVAFDRLTPGR